MNRSRDPRTGFGPRSATLALITVLLMACVTGCSAQDIRDVTPDQSGNPVGGLWYGIGQSVTPAEAVAVAKRYQMIVLNSWDVDALKAIKKTNPSAKVLVYKDLSSTRSYSGAVDNGVDATALPSGVGYVYASRNHPDWFATDSRNRRIEWAPSYPGHWQMAVWNTGYQQYWARQVTDEVVAQDWDGVLADNDFARLQFYSTQLIKGTGSADATNAKIRSGLDALVAVAGTRLQAAGKLFIPNIAEARLTPGRWTSHSRFGGAMEENFATAGQNGSILPLDTEQWTEMLDIAARGTEYILLITQGADLTDVSNGYASAALLAGAKTSWMAAPDPDYAQPPWQAVQRSALGTPVGPPAISDGLWTRHFADGVVAVNPTSTTKPFDIPQTGGASGENHSLPPGNAVVSVSQ
ncbi:putative glycoside hydrolase family 15 protein [Gordonia polyisoprenivorans]|uniref:putative glycoside hydrolase family 15 protein n=1 Tax=Gordonia polyisoprenivorans TaxID=84595 RepID=UPI000B99E20C|nr:putative glycoside hydrolase family 15 protein [Gordonia polyisoprenivorans]OZC29159.1 hypothetical protein CJJ17_25495 [Gordonia polyisoprenivorans]